MQIASGKILAEVERARVAIKVAKNGRYISGGAPELIERMLQKRQQQLVISEESSRGMSEFSSRQLVDQSPRSRFKD